MTDENNTFPIITSVEKGNASVNIANGVISTGAYNLDCEYAQNDYYQAGWDSGTLTVTKVTTISSIGCSISSANLGDSIILFGTIRDQKNNAIMEGIFTLYDNDIAVMFNQTLNNKGGYVISYTPSTNGLHSFKIIYEGTNTYESNTSNTCEIEVIKNTTTIIDDCTTIDNWISRKRNTTAQVVTKNDQSCVCGSNEKGPMNGNAPIIALWKNPIPFSGESSVSGEVAFNTRYGRFGLHQLTSNSDWNSHGIAPEHSRWELREGSKTSSYTSASQSITNNVWYNFKFNIQDGIINYYCNDDLIWTSSRNTGGNLYNNRSQEYTWLYIGTVAVGTKPSCWIRNLEFETDNHIDDSVKELLFDDLEACRYD